MKTVNYKAKPDLGNWVNCKMGVIKPEREEAFKGETGLGELG